MELGTIYAHINKLNGKAYVGQTKLQKITHRWANGKHYKGCTKFHRAIQKYGWENFDHVILEHVPLAVLNESEDLWISIFDSIKNGYNCNTTNPHNGYMKNYKYHISSSCFKKGHNTWNKKPIRCKETGEIFPAASLILGRHAKEVIEKQWCSHGYHWEWAEEAN